MGIQLARDGSVATKPLSDILVKLWHHIQIVFLLFCRYWSFLYKNNQNRKKHYFCNVFWPKMTQKWPKWIKWPHTHELTNWLTDERKPFPPTIKAPVGPNNDTPSSNNSWPRHKSPKIDPYPSWSRSCPSQRGPRVPHRRTCREPATGRDNLSGNRVPTIWAPILVEKGWSELITYVFWRLW